MNMVGGRRWSDEGCVCVCVGMVVMEVKVEE